MDVKQLDGSKKVWVDRGRENTLISPVEWAKRVSELGLVNYYLILLIMMVPVRDMTWKRYRKFVNKLQSPLLLLVGFLGGRNLLPVSKLEQMQWQ